MRHMIFLLLLSGASLARAGAFDDLSLEAGGLQVPPAPDAAHAEPIPADRAAENMAACSPDLRGDSSVPCVITTPKTTVCSDGQKIDVSKVTAQDVKAGQFSKAELGQYKNADLRAWAEHQQRLGASARWADGSHQSVLATGKVNPMRTAYVVLPNRAWLGRQVKVCLKATGACVDAQALEVGPKTTFKTHSEVSVKVLMDLGLNAHPESGTYYGEMTFTFR